MNKKQFLGVAYYPEAWERSQIAEDLDKMLDQQALFPAQQASF